MDGSDARHPGAERDIKSHTISSKEHRIDTFQNLVNDTKKGYRAHIHQGHDSSPKIHTQFPDPPMPPSHDRTQEPNPHNSSFHILDTSRDQAFLEDTHSQQNQSSNTDHFSVPGTSNHSTAQPSSRSPALSQRPARLTQDEPALDEDWLAQVRQIPFIQTSLCVLTISCLVSRRVAPTNRILPQNPHDILRPLCRSQNRPPE